MRRIHFVAILILYSVNAYSGESAFRVASPFTDNMVLQQLSEAPIWGWGTPGTLITLRAGWDIHASARVKPDGSWFLMISTPAAGGPYQVDIHHDDMTLALKNVMIGEVWLCSGQSNMEMPLQGWPPRDSIMNARQEIAASASPDIRFFTVRRTFSASPESTCDGAWVESSPATSPSFSATAYFFGKALHEALHVPIGLVHASWGGTPVEAWTSAEYLSRIERYDTTLQKIRKAAESMGLLDGWLRRFPVIEMRQRRGGDRWRNLDFRDEACFLRTYDDSKWREMALPTTWEKTDVGEFDGAVWFRKKIEIPAEWLHRDLVLELGPVDDIDITFVNGVKIGSHEDEGMWNADRIYEVPRTLVDSTTVQVAVRVIDYQGGGGIYGEAKSMNIHPKDLEKGIPLAGSWKFLPVAEYRGDRFSVMGPEKEQFFTRPRLPIDLSAYLPTTLYNGMIAPIVPYAIRGAIWYQGESNAGNPELYRQLFPLMIRNWRSAFQRGDFPFYYVQIAPFAYDKPTQSEYLREAQLLTMSLNNTGMAVTMDIGNFKNIHPANKQDVGKRLALWALAKTYGQQVSFSGPIYRSMDRVKKSIVLTFDNAGKGLVLKKKESGSGFQIAGEDRVFKDAAVKVQGSRLVVSHPDIKDPVAVRYAFSNTPDATLFNKEGLPASSFRTDDWAR